MILDYNRNDMFLAGLRTVIHEKKAQAVSAHVLDIGEALAHISDICVFGLLSRLLQLIVYKLEHLLQIWSFVE